MARGETIREATQELHDWGKAHVGGFTGLTIRRVEERNATDPIELMRLHSTNPYECHDDQVIYRRGYEFRIHYTYHSEAANGTALPDSELTTNWFSVDSEQYVVTEHHCAGVDHIPFPDTYCMIYINDKLFFAGDLASTSIKVFREGHVTMPESLITEATMKGA